MSGGSRLGRRLGWLVLTLVAVVGAAGLRAQDQPPSGGVVADKAKKLFHRPDCASLKKVGARNRVELADGAEAREKKYRPCPVCKPDADADQAEPAPAKTDDGTPSFKRDVAPILASNCVRCHNPRDKARRKNFDLSTFAGLMKGGDDGPAIVPGKPDESPLLLRVKGELTPKMPPGQNNLSEPAVARIERWVQAGAKLDRGLDAGAELAKYAASPDEVRRSEQAKRKPEELDRQTRQTSLARWKKASSSPPEVAEGKAFLVFSKLPPERTKGLLKALDAQVKSVQGLLQDRAGAAAGPEKISVFAFNDPKGYIEFVRANEGREVEPGTTAHANLGVESPYLAAVDPLKGAEEAPARKSSRSRKDDDGDAPERSLAGLLVEQLGVGAVASASGPRWLSLGLGAYLASGVEPRSPYYRTLRTRAGEVYVQGWMTKSREALAGEGDSETIRAIGFSLIEFLAANNRAFFPPFAREMIRDNKQFDDVIQTNLGATPEQFFQTWGSFVASRYSGARAR